MFWEQQGHGRIGFNPFASILFGIISSLHDPSVQGKDFSLAICVHLPVLSGSFG